MLRRFEQDGLLTRDASETDRRQSNLALTNAGRARYGQARPLWSEAQAHFEKGFGVRAAAELRELLAGIARDPSLVGAAEIQS